MEAADLPKSFFQLDVGGSDSEASSLPRSLGGVSGAGQSNLSTEVAALIQSEMASHHQRRQQQQQQLQNGLHHPNAPNLGQNDRESPDMDFLEMDFDPGDEDSDSNESDEADPKTQELLSTGTPEALPPIGRPYELSGDLYETIIFVSLFSEIEPLVQDEIQDDLPVEVLELNLDQGQAQPSGNISAPLISPAMELCSSMMTRSRSLNLSQQNLELPGNKRRHSGECCTASSSSSSTELCGARLSQREALVFGVPGSSQNVHRAMLKLRMLDPNKSVETVEKTMIWTELEACKRQVNQVGVSACGATALINVLQALDFPHTHETVIKEVPTKLRLEQAPIPEYLLSRSVAGTSHTDLIQSVIRITDGQIQGRFFSFYPERQVSLLPWLASWMKRGAVPIATLNNQKGLLPGQPIPDAWHHQMIFGVSPSGVFLTNPLESVSDQFLLDRLCSDSELLIRRSDIVSRYNPTCDLQPLGDVEDERWDHFNVLGQVVNVLREERQPVQLPSPSSNAGSSVTSNYQRTTHVRIPAMYQSGITLFVNVVNNSECYEALFACPELPYS